MKSISVHIKGQVYKTGYRFFVKQIADMFQIKGSIQYLVDQSVYIEAHGSPTKLYEFIKFCHIGNPISKVKQLNIGELPQITSESFEVKDKPLKIKL